MDIDHKAPAIAAAEALILAPLDVVWSVQTKIDEWSRWNPDVSKVDLRGPIKAGTEFHWKAGGVPISSVIRELEPKQRVSWTGRTLGIRSVHVWTFEETDNGVRVRTEESFDGLLVQLLAGPMRRMLASSLEKSVQVLKAECERRIKTGMA